MATNIPAKLKNADITRFAQRAAQVEAIKPAVAYWSYYWIVQQILGKSLHNQDDECKLYTTQLMDKLEEMKAQHPEDDAIADDMAGEAFVEQFGLDTFQRADNAIQTADTFQASATFLDLVHIWGPPSPEIASKIKYAKFHALRIAKALKAGEDPNIGNPAPTTPLAQDAIMLDPHDPEVQQFMDVDHQPKVEDAPDETDRLRRASAARSVFDQSLHPSRDASVHRVHPQQASVEDVPDEQHGLQAAAAATSILDQSLHPSRAPSVPPPGSAQSTTPAAPSVDKVSREGSVGGGYFPEVQLPAVPQDSGVSDPQYQPGPMSPTGFISPSTPLPPSDPQSYYTQSQPHAPPSVQQAPPPVTHHYQTPAAQPPQAPHGFRVPPPQAPAMSTGPPVRAPAPIPKDLQQYATEEEAILAAQKHAKWAISALNFEDIPTAIKELKLALQTLGSN